MFRRIRFKPRWRDRFPSAERRALSQFRQARTEFVDAIAQQIRLRPPQLVTQFAEPFDAQKALRLYLYRVARSTPGTGMRRLPLGKG
jgi:hypothetical protein